jgi:hypothetical protein
MVIILAYCNSWFEEAASFRSYSIAELKSTFSACFLLWLSRLLELFKKRNLQFLLESIRNKNILTVLNDKFNEVSVLLIRNFKSLVAFVDLRLLKI